MTPQTTVATLLVLATVATVSHAGLLWDPRCTPIRTLFCPWIRCDKARLKLSKLGAVTPFIPACAPDGSYEEEQCFTMTNHAGSHVPLVWKVNENDGKRIEGSTLFVKDYRCTSSQDYASSFQVDCEDARWLIESYTPDGNVVYHPHCTDGGDYFPRQCYQPAHLGAREFMSGLNNVCWCVDIKSGEPVTCSVGDDH